MTCHPANPARPYMPWKNKLRFQLAALESYRQPHPLWVRERIRDLKRRLVTSRVNQYTKVVIDKPAR